MGQDATEVIAGSGLLYVAPLGTTLPTIDGHGEYPVAWPSGWEAVGYTDDGIDMTYTPTVKPIMVDEETAPVFDLLTEEKFVVSAKLSQVTLANLNRAVSASVYTNDAANSNEQLSVGTKALVYYMVGIEGPAPGTNLKRIILVQKALATAPVAMKMQRKDKTTFQVNFEARKMANTDLFTIYDLTSTAS